MLTTDQNLGLGDSVADRKHVAFKDGDGHVQKPCVFFYPFSILGVVTGVPEFVSEWVCKGELKVNVSELASEMRSL